MQTQTKQTREAEKSRCRRKFHQECQKYLSKKNGTKRGKREKRHTFLFSFFISRKEYTTTTTTTTHASERFKERDVRLPRRRRRRLYYAFVGTTTARRRRRRRFFSKEESTFTTTTTTTTTTPSSSSSSNRYRAHLRRKTFASNNNNENNSDEATTTTKTQNEYFNCTIISNEPISPDESFRLLTVEIDDDVATVSRMSKQLKMNKEKANGKTTTGRTHTHTTRDSTIDGGYVKNEADFESEWLLRYKFPGQSAQFKLFKEEDWLREDVVDESLGRLTHKLPIAQSPTNLHMARKKSPGASTYTKAEFIVDGKKEEEAHLAKLEPQAKMKISNPRGFGFSNPLFSNEKTLDNAMMSDTIKVPIVIVAKESEGFACAKSLLSSPALLAHASIAPVTVFCLANLPVAPITVDEIERWKRGGVKIITSVNEDPDGIVDYHSDDSFRAFDFFHRGRGL